MPRERVSQFDVVCGLKELSDEADCASSELEFEGNGLFVDWFAAIKETLLKIRDCETVKDLNNIEYPSCTVLEENHIKNVDSGAPQTLRENVHAKVPTPLANKTPEKVLKEAECHVRVIKCDEIAADIKNKSSDSRTVTQSISSINVLKEATECQVRVTRCDEGDADCKNTPSENCSVAQSNSPVNILKEVAECRVRVVRCDEVDADRKNTLSENCSVAQSKSPIDILKEEAECRVRVVRCDEVDANHQNRSHESCAVNQSNSLVKLNNSVVKLKCKDVPKLDVTYNLCSPESNKPESPNLYQTPALNQTFNKIINKTLILDSGFSDNGNSKSKKVNNDSGVITRCASKKNTPASKNSAHPGCKRKSSSSTDENSKKPRNDVTAVGPASKTAQSKYPIRKVASKKAWNGNKPKVEAVIVPSVKPKKSAVSKEQQILEEIKKKEEKTNQNIKRVLAERQQKAEQNKKNREEKRTKMLQKKMQLVKEKEVCLEKHEAEVKTSQVKTLKENPVGKNRTNELIEQHLKENKLSGLSVSKQSDNIMNNAVKTPVNKIVEEEDDSYELTPLPDSSTYDFSDDEDEKPKGKHIPLWAQGVLLKHALIQQYYKPVDTDELFGIQIDPPNLAEIFQVNRKRYLKRTSSANWSSPPLSTSFER